MRDFLKLRPDWKKILFKANSMKWIAGAVVLSGLEVYFAIYGAPYGIPTGTFAALSGLTSAAAFYFRMRAQKEFEDAH
ncbi:hypothetical protein EV128_12519 [Rhizobium azibense]|nr:hypothetical protein EV128_12519 [Rhizobium azibense]